MTTIKTRGEFAEPSHSVLLDAVFRNWNGSPADPITFPTISIVQPNGNVLVSDTSLGVSRVGVGIYNFIYAVPYATYEGVYIDRWSGVMASSDGYRIEINEYNFVVAQSQLPGINSDGYIHLGDDVPFNYSQNEILVINKFIKALRARLNSSGKSRRKDEYGNVVYENCDIYSVEQLVTFIATALTAFNQIPHFTFFTFCDNSIMDMFFEVILQHAVIYSLSSKALIERGREFNFNDNGTSFTPPAVSDILSTQWSTEYTNWYDKVQLIKKNMKPYPLGLGTFSVTAASPQLAKLRHLRARRII